MYGVRHIGEHVLTLGIIQVEVEHVGNVAAVGDPLFADPGGDTAAGHQGGAALCLVGNVGDHGLGGIGLICLEEVEHRGRGGQSVFEHQIAYANGGQNVRIGRFHIHYLRNMFYLQMAWFRWVCSIIVKESGKCIAQWRLRTTKFRHYQKICCFLSKS